MKSGRARRGEKPNRGLLEVGFFENINGNLPELLGFMSPLVKNAAPLMMSPAIPH